jgi:hypothetical protein
MAANRAMGISDASDTFQEQRRIYIRGFATSSKDTDLALKVKNFFTNLVPHDDQPDHPDNLFTDVWDIYCSKPQSNGKDYAVEFVLELYTAGARDTATVSSAGRSGPGQHTRNHQGPPPRR